MRDVDAEEISFREIFLEGEAGEEQTDGTAAALSIIRSNWPEQVQGVRGVDVYRTWR